MQGCLGRARRACAVGRAERGDDGSRGPRRRPGARVGQCDTNEGRQVTRGAETQVDARESQQQLGAVGGALGARSWRRIGTEPLTGGLEPCGGVTCGVQPVVSDLHEAARQHVLYEAREQLLRVDRDGLGDSVAADGGNVGPCKDAGDVPGAERRAGRGAAARRAREGSGREGGGGGGGGSRGSREGARRRGARARASREGARRKRTRTRASREGVRSKGTRGRASREGALRRGTRG